MPDDERSYFLDRAEEELQAAEAAGHPDAARAHFLLAGFYFDLAHNPAAGRAVAPRLPDRGPPFQVTGEAAFA